MNQEQFFLDLQVIYYGLLQHFIMQQFFDQFRKQIFVLRPYL